jgi:hypothetical protein
MQHHRHTTILSLVVAGAMTAALATTPAAGRPADFHYQAPAPRATIDLRSPDVRDADRPVAIDLRSPDAAQPVRLPAAKPSLAPQQVPSSDNGFDVISALIGGGAALLIALSGVALARNRGRRVARLV